MNSPLLGLDIGLRRTGVALSESGLIAQPLAVIEAKPPHLQAMVQQVLQYVQKYEIKTVVVGLPLGEDNEITSQSLKVERIVNMLTEELQKLPDPPEITQVNEYHSTQDSRLLYPGADSDSAAAALILQDYLDQNS